MKNLNLTEDEKVLLDIFRSVDTAGRMEIIRTTITERNRCKSMRSMKSHNNSNTKVINIASRREVAIHG